MKSIDILKKPLAVLVSEVLGIVSPEKWLALTLNCVFTVIWGTPFSDPFFSRVIHPIVSSLTGIKLRRTPKPEEYALCSSSQSPTSTIPSVMPIWSLLCLCAPQFLHLWVLEQKWGSPFLRIDNISAVTLPSACVFRFYQHMLCFTCRFSCQHGLVCWVCLTCVHSLSPLYIQMSLCVQSLALL